MFESIKYRWNAGKFVGYVAQLQKALESGDQNLVLRLSEYALQSGKRALELSDKVEGISAETTNYLRLSLNNLEEIYVALQPRNEPTDSLRQAVKKQFVQLGSQIGVAGGGKAEDFIADRMVDMYRIAADRLDSSSQVLRMIYVDNDTAPEPLREVMNQYLDGKLTKDETAKKLAGLKSKTEQYVRDLGAKPEQVQVPTVIYNVGTANLEERLKCEIVADSMRDDGSVDGRLLFLNTAEIVFFDKLAGLARNLEGREPTAEEVINAQIEAWEATYDANPSLGFGNEPEFHNWINEKKGTMNSKQDAILQLILPVYRSVSRKS